jgi:hypothetical protein
MLSSQKTLHILSFLDRSELSSPQHEAFNAKGDLKGSPTIAS